MRRGGVKRPAGMKPGQKTLNVGVPDRYLGFITGELSVEDLDDEEVMRGSIRNKRGDFAGRSPNAIPRQFLLAIQIEQQRRFQEKMNPLVNDALKLLAHMMDPNYRATPGDAAKAKLAMFTIERFAGKTPENVNIKAEVTSKFENIAEEILIDVDEPKQITQGETDELGDI